MLHGFFRAELPERVHDRLVVILAANHLLIEKKNVNFMPFTPRQAIDGAATQEKTRQRTRSQKPKMTFL